MPGALPIPTDCDCDEAIETLVPGAAGTNGADGADGNPGANAFTNLAAGFVMPAVDGEVVVTVNEGDWIGIGQNVFVEFAGYMKCTAREGNSVTLQNLGYSGNAPESADIANGALVSPAGVVGVTGATGTSLSILSGVGSPVGAVVGNELQFYVKTDAPKALFQKEAGTGNGNTAGWYEWISA